MAHKYSPPPRVPLFIDEKKYVFHPMWEAFFEQFLEHTVYLGRKDEEGAWRIVRSGDDLNFERLESGAWVEKGQWTAEA